MTNKTVKTAVDYLQQNGAKPNPAEVVSALATVEKQHKKAKQSFAYEDLIGSWQLGFVSGTRTVRPRPSALPVKKLGKGRFLPKWTTVEITYEPEDEPEDELEDSKLQQGTVANRVKVGPLQLCLTGPTQFWDKPGAIAFDFTHIAVNLGSWTAYSGPVRGGDARRQAFKTQPLKDQAFFTFFLIEDECVAARGKGGGLALWTRRAE